VLAVALAPNLTHVTSAGEDRVVRTWPADDRLGQWVHQATDRVGPGPGTPAWGMSITGVTAALRFNADGRVVAIGADHEIRLCAVGDGCPLATIRHGGTAGTMAFSAGGTRLASGGGTLGHEVKIWSTDELETLSSKTELPEQTITTRPLEPISGVALDPPCRCVVIAAGKSAVRMLSVTGGTELWSAEGTSPALRVAYDRAGARLMVAWSAGEILVYSVEAITGFDDTQFDTQRLLAGMGTYVQGLSATGLGVPKLWSDTHDGGIVDAVLSADGGRVATAGTDGTVRLWDLTTLPVQALESPPLDGRAHALALSPDGRLLAVGLDTGVVALCRVEAPRDA
jgi:WD40 repeat protein